MMSEPNLEKILEKTKSDYKRKLKSEIKKRILSNFDNEQDVDGNSFSPLRPSTLKQKKRSGYGSKPILVRKGNLRKGIDVSLKNDNIEVTTKQKYGVYLNDGRSNMAARRILDIPKSFEEGSKERAKIVEEAAEQLREGILKEFEKFDINL